jgi:hypothetical protein
LELQDEIVGLRPKHLVSADDDRPSVERPSDCGGPLTESLAVCTNSLTTYASTHQSAGPFEVDLGQRQRGLGLVKGSNSGSWREVCGAARLLV